MKEPFYITTPIYYVNDSPHIGHAYTTIACDVMARFMRLSDRDVMFLTGTDEHGQKVDKAAEKAGVDPQSFTDEVSKRFRNLVATGDNLLNVTNDDFVRTTDNKHKKAAQELWRRIDNNGHIYKDKYAGWYSVRDEAYYQESELVDGKAPTGAEVEWVEEESYFFDLSKWQDKLLKFYEENPDFIIPKSRYNEVVSFVKGGLRDLSISRTTFKWGVNVPDDDDHVMYVWIDALTNYLTGIGFPDDTQTFDKYWEDAIHVVGKDILRFHAVYWPAFLMAARLPLPQKIIAHGWWTIEGEKMSKSLGNVIAPKDLIDEFGIDQMRYFLMREVPFGNDGNFSRKNMKNRINSELANNIGNLAQRTLSMIWKNCEGRIPDVRCQMSDVRYQISEYENHMRNAEFSQALAYVIRMADNANEYIDEQAPWVLKKEGKIDEMCSVLYNLAEAIRCIAILLQPFCPDSAARILDQLSVSKDKRQFKHLTDEFALKSGTVIQKPEGVFPRFE